VKIPSLRSKSNHGERKELQYSPPPTPFQNPAVELQNMFLRAWRLLPKRVRFRGRRESVWRSHFGFARRKFALNKVTGASERALEDVVDPSVPKNIFEFVRSVRHMETGVVVLNAGMILSLLGTCSSDIVFLRSMSITGGICGMYYNFTRKPPLKAPVIWAVIFASIHLIKIGEIMLDKADISFSGDELNLFETHLNELPARRFYKFLEVVQKRDYQPGDVLLEEGLDVDSITFIMTGECDVLVKDQMVAKMEGCNSSGVLGEISFLNRLRLEKEKKSGKLSIKRTASVQKAREDIVRTASARVVANTNVHTITVKMDDLIAMFKQDPQFKAIFLSALTNTLVAKLVQQSTYQASNKGDSYLQLVKKFVHPFWD
jgi:CRP-like cAMP-binding protein